MKKVIGLTGGIACGKTTVSNILKKLGAFIIDADKISREVVKKGSPALREIASEFGDNYLLTNGELNRKKMGELVFSDSEALTKLNKITHPKIVAKIQNEIKWSKENSNYHVIIVDAALLIENNLTELVDEVWLVTASEHIQINRIMKRDSITEQEAKLRIDSQMTVEEKRKFACNIIDNSASLERLNKIVKSLWQEFK
ncbi:MAG: dephospho-CoA kinase [Alkaliphilus sp.]|nr:dephospho-CoA kinase [bacterium AH-315-G05]PHS29670.1 MAG: dephospho-CoA kinase [Alkaliphilus sp.]